IGPDICINRFIAYAASRQRLRLTGFPAFSWIDWCGVAHVLLLKIPMVMGNLVPSLPREFNT
ncbi:MAG: hypothetical protein ACK53Y_15140, partial [bacterium]